MFFIVSTKVREGSNLQIVADRHGSAERADETLALLKDNGEAGYAIGTIVPDTDGTQLTPK